MEFHPISELDAKEKPEVLAKAREMYERESFNMRLRALRGTYGGTGEDADGVSAPAVRNLERRKDITISTLIDYIKSLGLGLEISALPPDANAGRKVLLKI